MKEHTRKAGMDRRDFPATRQYAALLGKIRQRSGHGRHLRLCLFHPFRSGGERYSAAKMSDAVKRAL